MKIIHFLFFLLFPFFSHSQELIKAVKRYTIELPDSSKEFTSLVNSAIQIFNNHAYFTGTQHLGNYRSNYIFNFDLLSNELKYIKSNLPFENSMDYPIGASFFEINNNLYLHLNLDYVPDFYNQNLNNQIFISSLSNDSIFPELSIPERFPAKGLAHNDSILCFTSTNNDQSFLNIYDVINKTLNEIRLDSIFNDVLYTFPYANGDFPRGTDADFRFSIIKNNIIYFTTFVYNNISQNQEVNLFSYNFQNNEFDILFNYSDSLFNHQFRKMYLHNNEIRFQYIKIEQNGKKDLYELSISNNSFISKKITELPSNYMFEKNIKYINPSPGLSNIHFITNLNSIKDSIFFVSISDNNGVYKSNLQQSYSSLYSPPVLVYENKIVIPHYFRIRNDDFSNDLIQQINVYDENLNLLYTYIDSLLSFQDVFGEPCNKIISGQYIVENDSLFLYAALNNFACNLNSGINPYDGFRIVKYYIDINSILSNHQVIENNFVSIFPNPGNQSFNLQSTEFKGMSNISVSNQLGQIIYQTQQNEPNITIQADAWPAGIYFVNVKQANAIQTLKWIKQ